MGLIVSVEGDKKVVREHATVDSGEVGIIAEMVTDPTSLERFHPGWGAKGAALATASGDDNPEFPVVRVEEGWSRSGRLYSGEFLDSVAEQCNALEPVGHLGHIPDEQVGTALPDPQTTWFGAFTRMEQSKAKDRVGEMVKAIYFAGYNLKDAKIRGFLKAKAVRGVSWFGFGDMVPVPGKGVEVKNFDLRALDWARKLGEGMPTSSVVAIASEMEDNKMDKALSQVTPEEFEKENPNGYALLVAKVTAASDQRIAEMEEKVTKADEAQSLLVEIRKALKIPDGADPLQALANAMSKLGAKAKDALALELDKVLAAKVPDEEQRKLVKRLLPVAEMEVKLSDAADDADTAKLVTEMVTESFDKDDMIKQIVSEQAAPVIRKREELRDGDKTGGTNPYITRERRSLA